MVELGYYERLYIIFNVSNVQTLLDISNVDKIYLKPLCKQLQ